MSCFSGRTCAVPKYPFYPPFNISSVAVPETHFQQTKKRNCWRGPVTSLKDWDWGKGTTTPPPPPRECPRIWGEAFRASRQAYSFAGAQGDLRFHSSGKPAREEDQGELAKLAQRKQLEPAGEGEPSKKIAGERKHNISRRLLSSKSKMIWYFWETACCSVCT